jgi:adenine phosphoribosyltransferase
MTETERYNLASIIRDVPDFPKPGILFKDITPLLHDPSVFAFVIELMAAPHKLDRPDIIAGIESRGFIFGAPLALQMGIPFVPIRKPGKLPWKTRSASYELEYGKDTIEIHEDAIISGQRVLLVDDLLATGGTMAAACELVSSLGGEIIETLFLIELNALKGRDRLKGEKVRSLIRY